MADQVAATAWIALGANLGDPQTTLRWARAELARLGAVTAVSALYRTAPVGGPAGQPDYLNAALSLRTQLGAPDLLAALHDIEARAGRERRERWEARTLDLDLILYGDLVIHTPALTLPHPRAWERAFVLAPLADLGPQRRHPETGQTVAAALVRLEQSGVGLDGVFRETSDW
ncbi:2-amino-4-hydroxy-6-hydroxymethyldihydropteridine diphosphokinase [Deinococcus aquatilis]|jgi:2-amino-4-hydroxy-6-hydroxymethyldihydropteridine diphosphokinase|uniref:2-amino-4-hydroxy-6- hydroxymethyldihydropteridine diphosphokinase n=1 Tax=Deinococcus aquatilis TaxID=519440 RepID=UPI00036A0189|nr:2-amino-4-hydroxy-6-hydroxymethyldihydropteridine diphosphokinase [Deinococcus aquatilis]